MLACLLRMYLPIPDVRVLIETTVHTYEKYVTHEPLYSIM